MGLISKVKSKIPPFEAVLQTHLQREELFSLLRKRRVGEDFAFDVNLASGSAA